MPNPERGARSVPDPQALDAHDDIDARDPSRPPAGEDVASRLDRARGRHAKVRHSFVFLIPSALAVAALGLVVVMVQPGGITGLGGAVAAIVAAAGLLGMLLTDLHHRACVASLARERLQRRIDHEGVYSVEIESLVTRYVGVAFGSLQRGEATMRSAYWLTVFVSVLSFGMLLVLIGAYVAGAAPEGAAGYAQVAGAVLAQFVAAVFFAIYGKTVSDVEACRARLAREYGVALAVAIAKDGSFADDAELKRLLIRSAIKHENGAGGSGLASRRRARARNGARRHSSQGDGL